MAVSAIKSPQNQKVFHHEVIVRGNVLRTKQNDKELAAAACAGDNIGSEASCCRTVPTT